MIGDDLIGEEKKPTAELVIFKANYNLELEEHGTGFVMVLPSTGCVADHLSLIV